MALGILAEAVLRIEHKLDIIMTRLGFLDPTPPPQLGFVGTTCPVCRSMIEYQIDITNNVVVRKCGCKTGKQPSTIPLIPIPGVPNGNPASAGNTQPVPGSDEPAADAPYRTRRKGR